MPTHTEDRRTYLVNFLREIASRGHIDDFDVPLIFDAADELESLAFEAQIHGL